MNLRWGPIKWWRSCFQFLPTSPKHATTTHWPVMFICSCHKWWLSWNTHYHSAKNRMKTTSCRVKSSYLELAQFLPQERQKNTFQVPADCLSPTGGQCEVTSLSSLWHSCHATITSKSLPLNHTNFLFLLSSSPHYLCISRQTFRSRILQSMRKEDQFITLFDQPADRRRRWAGR